MVAACVKLRSPPKSVRNNNDKIQSLIISAMPPISLRFDHHPKVFHIYCNSHLEYFSHALILSASSHPVLLSPLLLSNSYFEARSDIPVISFVTCSFLTARVVIKKRERENRLEALTIASITITQKRENIIGEDYVIMFSS